MTYRFWLSITVVYFSFLILAAIWEGGAAVSGILGTSAEYANSPSAGVYSRLLGLLSSPDIGTNPGGITADGSPGEPEQGFLFPGDFLSILGGIITLDYAFLRGDGWGQVLRWAIVILWLGPLVGRAIIFSISWLFNRRSQ